MPGSINASMAKHAWTLFGDPELKEQLKQVKTNALRNLLHASMEAELLEELLIALEYQKGRKLIAAPVADRLMAELKKKADEEAKAAQGSAAEEVERRRLVAARSLLGHLVRLHRTVAD